MGSRVPRQYQELLRQAYAEGSVPSESHRPLKRRHRSEKSVSPVPDDIHVHTGPSTRLHLNGSTITNSGKKRRNFASGSSKKDSISLVSSDEEVLKNSGTTSAVATPHNIGIIEVVDLDDSEDKEQRSDNEDDDDDFDEEEFEDVDLSETISNDSRVGTSGKLPLAFDQLDKQNTDINVVIQAPAEDPKERKKSNRINIITMEEKLYRQQIHKLYLASMVAHGAIRNAWSSNPHLQGRLYSQAPIDIKDDVVKYRLFSKSSNSVQSKTRKLLDLLKKIMQYWYKSFTVTSGGDGLFKQLWCQFGSKLNEKKSSKITFGRFSRYLEAKKGSRYLAVQGFVTLLRSFGFQTRFVFSIQPPDFTNMQRDDSNKTDSVVSSREVSPTQRGKGAKSKKDLSTSDRILESLRVNKPVYISSKSPKTLLDEAKYPIMWCEVWNRSDQKWITIDPIVQKKLEVTGLKSMLEPPLSDPTNNTFYVVSYDNYGSVRDITRRYSQHFNAKVRRKRITREDDGCIWYDKLLLSACTSKGKKYQKIDLIEKNEFDKRSVDEGMPNNIQDFKGHPIYVLEEHLKQNEILHPQISRGQIRRKGGGMTAVYSRKYVHVVRSAKAWYMRGRVLKMGERPMKIREEKPKQRRPADEDDYRLSEDDDDGDVNLFAEFQTELYVPPPIVDGTIPVNAYGNIDIYTKSMIPKGAIHIEGKFVAKAAKLIGVEYANAVTGFDFGGGGRRSKGFSVASARVNGAVVLEENAEAVKLVSDYLQEEEIEESRKREELLALRAWKVLLMKLRIKERLNKHHGSVEKDQADDQIQQTEDEDSYNDVSEGDDGDEDDDSHMQMAYGAGGGFLVDHNDEEFHFSADDIDPDDNGEEGVISEELNEEDDVIPSHYGMYDFGNKELADEKEFEPYPFLSHASSNEDTSDSGQVGGYTDEAARDKNKTGEVSVDRIELDKENHDLHDMHQEPAHQPTQTQSYKNIDSISALEDDQTFNESEQEELEESNPILDDPRNYGFGFDYDADDDDDDEDTSVYTPKSLEAGKYTALQNHKDKDDEDNMSIANTIQSEVVADGWSSLSDSGEVVSEVEDPDGYDFEYSD